VNIHQGEQASLPENFGKYLPLRKWEKALLYQGATCTSKMCSHKNHFHPVSNFSELVGLDISGYGVCPNPGYVIVDIDSRENCQCLGLTEKYIQSCYRVKTPSGGLHLYCRTNQKITSHIKLVDGIDIIGNSGGAPVMAVGPGSVLWDVDLSAEEKTYQHEDGVVQYLPIPLLQKILERQQKDPVTVSPVYKSDPHTEQGRKERKEWPDLLPQLEAHVLSHHKGPTPKGRFIPVRCFFHSPDKNPSAWYDRNTGFYGCYTCGVRLTALEFTKSLNLPLPEIVPKSIKEWELSATQWALSENDPAALLTIHAISTVAAGIKKTSFACSVRTLATHIGNVLSAQAVLACVRRLEEGGLLGITKEDLPIEVDYRGVTIAQRGALVYSLTPSSEWSVKKMTVNFAIKEEKIASTLPSPPLPQYTLSKVLCKCKEVLEFCGLAGRGGVGLRGLEAILLMMPGDLKGAGRGALRRAVARMEQLGVVEQRGRGMWGLRGGVLLAFKRIEMYVKANVSTEKYEERQKKDRLSLISYRKWLFCRKYKILEEALDQYDREHGDSTPLGQGKKMVAKIHKRLASLSDMVMDKMYHEFSDDIAWEEV